MSNVGIDLTLDYGVRALVANLSQGLQILLQESLLTRFLERVNLEKESSTEMSITLENILGRLAELLGLDTFFHKGLVANWRFLGLGQGRNTIPVSNFDKGTQSDPPEPLVRHFEVVLDLGRSVALVDDDELVNRAADRESCECLRVVLLQLCLSLQEPNIFLNCLDRIEGDVLI